MKKNDLLEMFKYQIFNVKNSEILAVSQNSQKKHDYKHFLHAVLDQKTRIIKI